MTEPQSDGWLRNGKNIVILALCIIALAEFVLLVQRHVPPVSEVPGQTRPQQQVASQPSAQAPTSSATAEGVRVVGLAMDPERGRYLLLAFDRPVLGAKDGAVPTADPAAIEPAVPGKWTWISPYMLRFEAKDGFAQATQYTVTLRPEAFLGKGQEFSGQPAYQASYGTFEVNRLTAHLEPAPEGGAMG